MRTFMTFSMAALCDSGDYMGDNVDSYLTKIEEDKGKHVINYTNVFWKSV